MKKFESFSLQTYLVVKILTRIRLRFVVQDATRDYKFQAKITFEILEGGTQISASACCCALLPRAVV